GNAITEALVFGRRAGLAAAEHAERAGLSDAADSAADTERVMSGGADRLDMNPAAVIAKLRSIMIERVGHVATRAGVPHALAEIGELRQYVGAIRPRTGAFDRVRLDWFDARNMLLVAEAVARSALERRESRGAHQREDYPAAEPARLSHLTVKLESGRLQLEC